MTRKASNPRLSHRACALFTTTNHYMQQLMTAANVKFFVYVDFLFSKSSPYVQDKTCFRFRFVPLTNRRPFFPISALLLRVIF